MASPGGREKRNYRETIDRQNVRIALHYAQTQTPARQSIERLPASKPTQVCDVILLDFLSTHTACFAGAPLRYRELELSCHVCKVHFASPCIAATTAGVAPFGTTNKKITSLSAPQHTVELSAVIQPTSLLAS